ncbi:MAG: PSD1 and planctomycete cytochrome C domain-containing protein [Bryobacteraceae bacterium]
MRFPRHRHVLFLAALALSAGLGAANKASIELAIKPIDPAESARISFHRQVKPILDARCRGCHSPENPSGNFDVTTVASLKKAGSKGVPGVIPGKPDESAIVQYIRGVKEPQMPRELPPLSEDELHVIRMWIKAGAVEDAPGTTVQAKVSEEPALTLAEAVSKPQDPAFLKALTEKLFTGDYDDMMILRRNLRVAQLPGPPAPPEVAVPVNNVIDQFIAAKWTEKGLPEAKRPPKLAGDAEFLRRVYLDVIGVIPTVEEAQRFLSDQSPDKRTKLIDELLARNEDYAAHWTPFWEEALGTGATAGVGGIANRGALSDWIFKSFAENRPYDIMVAELIDPKMPGYQESKQLNANGKLLESAYIRNATHTDTIQSAANVGQVFLGTGMKCASCHSHFTNPEWSQSRFLAFAGMFAEDDLELIRCEKKSGQFVEAAFPFEIPGAPSQVPEDLESRFQRAAQLLTDPMNPRFAKTIVNRLWKRYVGIGLFEPADDFRLDRPASHPELLEWLAWDFMKNGYDLKHTIRLILTSRTYQHAYDPELEDHFEISKASEPRYYRSPSLRRMTAEQVIDSMQVVAWQKLDPARRLYLDKTSTALTRALGRPASRSEISTSRPSDVAVVQSLELLNGQEFYSLLLTGEFLDGLAEEKNLNHIVEKLYWAVLSRPPSQQEIALGVQFLKASGMPRSEVMLDPIEKTWFSDELPAGAVAEGNQKGEPWPWIEGAAEPLLEGVSARKQNAAADQQVRHHLYAAHDPLQFKTRDKLFTYVYLDPANPPKELRMGWSRSGRASYSNVAYWAAAADPAATKQTYMGPLPEPGKWVRLEVPAAKVGMKPDTRGISGWSFGQTGGLVYWGKTGLLDMPLNPAAEPLGDMLWALAAGPQFQFIH